MCGGGWTDRSATRNLGPSFSSSAMTQSVTQGMPVWFCQDGGGERTGYGHTFRVETVHHPTDEFQLVLQGEVYEIGIDEDAVRRCESCVVC